MTDPTSLEKTQVGPGTYTNATITVDEYGRVTFATNGRNLNNSISVSEPLTVTATYPQQIGIKPASTHAAGIVQLDDSVLSDASDKAATPSAVKKAHDLAALAYGSISTASNDAHCAKCDSKKAIEDAASACLIANVTSLSLAETQKVANDALQHSKLTASELNHKIPTSAFTTKGALLIGTGQTEFLSAPPGFTGDVLCVDPEQTTGLKWRQPRIETGYGLEGGPIGITGTINLSKTGVQAGEYLNANITVDEFGRVTAASDGYVGGDTHGNTFRIVELTRKVEELTAKLTELEGKLS